MARGSVWAETIDDVVVFGEVDGDGVVVEDRSGRGQTADSPFTTPFSRDSWRRGRGRPR